MTTVYDYVGSVSSTDIKKTLKRRNVHMCFYLDLSKTDKLKYIIKLTILLK